MSESLPNSSSEIEQEAPNETHEENDHSPESDLTTQDAEVVIKYQEGRETAQTAFDNAIRERNSNENLSRVRESLGLATSQQHNSFALDDIEALEAELIRAEANYPGHWTLLLADRLRDPETKKKFLETRTEALPSLQEGNPGPFDREKRFRAHYEEQMANYEENIESVFNQTVVGNAAEFGKKPVHAGSGNIGEPGPVFLDSETKEGLPLTPRQKMIIEAHEKGHGMRDFQGSDAIEIRSVLDFSVLKEREEIATAQNPQDRFANYLNKPEEIIERMAQLKNYFGFKGNEVFTKKHLDYAREHYIQDTGLDNTMSHFFAAVTPETEDHFIEVMNKYPI
ncbi:MAG: hypothetical protein AAB921_04210 [Patescibacteria group bacterium]